MGLFDFLTKTIGVDPGSQTLRVVSDGKLIFNETAEISIDSLNNEVSGFGNESTKSTSHKIIKPVNTVIADFHGFEHLLRGSLKKSLKGAGWFSENYRMYISIPLSTTEVEKRAYRDSAEHAAAKEVYMIYQPVCSAIGMGVLFEKKDFILVDFSASKVEVTVFSDAQPIAGGAIRIGTWKLKQLIINQVSRSHKIVLADFQVEDLLRDLPQLPTFIEIEHKQIGVDELRSKIDACFTLIEDRIFEIFEEASSNSNINRILANGVYFTGGGSHLGWLTKRLALGGKMIHSTSPTPLIDNANGIAKVLLEPDLYNGYLMV
jgi:rod shape-determining protein MreB and related proteins